MSRMNILFLMIAWVLSQSARWALAGPQEGILQQEGKLEVHARPTDFRVDGNEAESLLGEKVDVGSRIQAYRAFAKSCAEFVESGPAGATACSVMRECYEAFSRADSVQAMLLADSAKRCFLAYACEQMAAGADFDVIRMLRDQAETFALSPDQFLSMGTEKTEDCGSIRGGENLFEALQLICRAHELAPNGDDERGLQELMRRYPTDANCSPAEIAETENRLALAMRLLRTEQFRVVAFQGLCEFLLRSGNLDKVSMADSTYFYSVIPMEECRQLNFPPLAKKFLTPADVLTAAGRFPRTASVLQWMKTAFK